MNNIIKKFLLAGDKFMPEMYIYVQCLWAIQIIKKNNKNTKIQTNRKLQVYLQERACFQHGMVYGDFKDLPRRTTSDKL